MEYPKLVTIAIIEIDNKILLIRRGNEPEIGKWAFPSGAGAFEKFSNPMDAVKCEVDYDLNVSFSPFAFLNIYYREGAPPTLSLVYIGKIEGEIKINETSVYEYKLVNKEELKSLNLAFDQNKMVADYILRCA